MSLTTSEIADLAEEAAVAACWRQWASVQNLGTPIGERPTQAIIDPEALVMLSLSVHRRERRLTQTLEWWAAIGGTLMSVQRMQTLLGELPESVEHEVGWFAAHCVQAGDRRWKSLTSKSSATKNPRPHRAGKDPEHLRLLDPSTLMLRLRAGVGVGAKADLLAFLIGMTGTLGEREAWATAEVIAKGISYSSASIRRAAADMTLARLIEASGDRPMEFSVDASAWATLLRLEPTSTERAGKPLAWRFWSQMFAFLADTLDWSEATKNTSAIVQASRARDIIERYRQPLRWNSIQLPDPHTNPGEQFLVAFHQSVGAVCEWMERAL